VAMDRALDEICRRRCGREAEKEEAYGLDMPGVRLAHDGERPLGAARSRLEARRPRGAPRAAGEQPAAHRSPPRLPGSLRATRLALPVTSATLGPARRRRATRRASPVTRASPAPARRYATRPARTGRSAGKIAPAGPSWFLPSRAHSSDGVPPVTAGTPTSSGLVLRPSAPPSKHGRPARTSRWPPGASTRA
jgi:hypothetical protein